MEDWMNFWHHRIHPFTFPIVQSSTLPCFQPSMLPNVQAPACTAAGDRHL